MVCPGECVRCPGEAAVFVLLGGVFGRHCRSGWFTLLFKFQFLGSSVRFCIRY